MNSELARIHARICGDGNISKYETSETDRNRRAEVMYTNYDSDNIDEFRKDLDSQFGVKGTIYENRVRVKSIRLVDALEEKFGDFDSKEFDIPENISSSTDQVKFEWLRAFIRDEGYYDETNNRLRIKLMNKSALDDIKQLLKDLDIKSSVTGPNCDESWYLTVSSLDNYKELLKVAKDKPKVK